MPGITPYTSHFNPRPRAGGDIVRPAGGYYSHYFNPRPRAGGDAPATSAGASTAYFNPRPRAGGDQAMPGQLEQLRIFQSTPPRRGRQGWGKKRRYSDGFQSTPPRRGRPRSNWLIPRNRTDFNPRPRAGGDYAAAHGGSVRYLISIHAPVQGATSPSRPRCPPCRISIHAPAQGATNSGGRMAVSQPFQSTPPRRGRPP